jgi:LytS/YehU family sensor histidine kinase
MELFNKTKLNNSNLINAFILIALYIIVGQFNSFFGYSIIPRVIIAIDLAIVVIAGIFFGKEIGLIVGLMGTAINAVIMGGSSTANFEYASIIPHLIMGWTAGKIAEKKGWTFVGAAAILVGRFLDILAYAIFGLITITKDLSKISFWRDRGYEVLLGAVIIVAVCWIYLKIFHKEKKDNKDNKDKKKK